MNLLIGRELLFEMIQEFDELATTAAGLAGQHTCEIAANWIVSVICGSAGGSQNPQTEGL
jgi:hypothetical protein